MEFDDKLPIVHGAAFDSYVDQHEDECYPGTRSDILRQIREWASSPQARCIFWLNGMAGTGKSTISRTVSTSSSQAKWLGASFFFKRGEGDRGNATKLFPTIAVQLANNLPRLIPGIQRAVQDDPAIAMKGIKEQFDKLLLQPLLSLRLSDHPIQTVVIVIDALDECEGEKDVRLILQLLPQLQKPNAVRLRVFLTSRPELPIRIGFKKIANHDHKDLFLHEIPKEVIKDDISLFLNYRLSEIREEREPPLPIDWPGATNVRNLVALSVPLFIFAATICRIFEDPDWDPLDSLPEILTHQRDESKLGATYLPVLNRLLNRQVEKQKKQLVEEFQQVVGVIVVLESPLSVVSLSRLIGLPERIVQLRLNPLHSVLNVPDDDTLPVRLFHLSFRDFLLDPETREKTLLWVDEKDVHYRLTTRCLLVCQNLRKNICGLPSDGVQRADIDQQTIDHCLPPELQYSCRYWAHHLARSKNPFIEMKSAFLFLQRHFLHWIEAMSILGLASEIPGIINLLKSVLDVETNIQFSDFLHDAKRFILRNRQMADEYPLQIYCSGLLFTPTASVIRNQFERELPSWVRVLLNSQETWGTELQTLEGHSGPALSLVFSPDGLLLASASSDKTVRLWDTVTGALQQILEGHTSRICSVTFSPDGRLLASASEDRTVRLWETTTGALQKILEGHSDRVQSVGFSPDGRLVASASHDATVRLWDTTTGALQQTMEGYSGWDYFVAFSVDGHLIAFANDRGVAQLWDTTTGALRQTLEGHSGPIWSVVFSPDGRLLASASYGRTVRLWETTTGALQQILEGHSSRICSVTFSPDGRLLASASYDRTVRIWETTTGALQKILEGHSGPVRSVAFSPDGQLLASASDDTTVRLWDTTTGALQQTHKGCSGRIHSVNFAPEDQLVSAFSDNAIQVYSTTKCAVKHAFESHLGPVYSVIFSPHGRVLATASADKTIQLWDTANGALRQTLEVPSGPVFSVTFSPEGRLLASISADKIVRLWDTATGTLRQTLDVGLSPHYSKHSPYTWRASFSWSFSVNFSPDGRQLASVFGDITIRHFDAATGALQWTLEGHSGEIYGVGFSPDGRLLASASKDKTVRLWDTATGALQQTLEGHPGAVLSVAFSPDGRLVASACSDQTVRLWDTATGALQQTLEGHSGAVLSVAFSPDGRLVASASRDQTVLLWDTSTGNLHQTVQAQGAATKLEFFSGELLATNRGHLKFDPWCGEHTSGSPRETSEIFLQDDHWVTLRGKKALWLPLEYRPFSSAVKDKTLALGHASGRTSIIEFYD